MRKTLTRTGVVGLTLGATMTIGIALAAWTASGTGGGDVEAGTATALDVSHVTIDAIYPTVPVEVTVTVENPNPYAVTIASVTPGAVTADVEACTASSVAVETLSGLSTVIAAGGSQTFDLTATMANATADDDCQGATFSFDVTAAGASS